MAIVDTYFLGWMLNLEGVPKFVTGAEPFKCAGEGCTSIFLPGGVEQIRLLDTVLDRTLLQDNFLSDCDSLITYNTPGYQIDLFPPSEEFKFRNETDCMSFGQVSGEGLYMCIGSDGEKNLVVGILYIPLTFNFLTSF